MTRSEFDRWFAEVAARVGMTTEQLAEAGRRITAEAVAAGRIPAQVSDETLERVARIIVSARRARQP